MTQMWYQALSIVLLVASSWLSVLGSHGVKAVGRNLTSTASAQHRPSDRELLDVLRLLPGEPQHWRFPGSVALRVLPAFEHD